MVVGSLFFFCVCFLCRLLLADLLDLFVGIFVCMTGKGIGIKRIKGRGRHAACGVMRLIFVCELREGGGDAVGVGSVEDECCETWGVGASTEGNGGDKVAGYEM